MRSPFRFCLAAAIALGAGACAETSGPGGSNASNATQVFLTDAPFPFDAVRSVEIYVVSVAVAVSADTVNGEADWITVAEPRQRFDVLKLQNGNTALLGEKELEPGAYAIMRFIINTDSSRITWSDGREATVNWKLPGEISLHPLVDKPLGIPPEGSRLVIDFNVGQSFPYNVISGFEFDFLPWMRAEVQSGTSP